MGISKRHYLYYITWISEAHV